MKNVIFLGGGGFAREVLDTIEVINIHTGDHISPLGFIYEDANEDKGNLIDGLPVLGDLTYLKTINLNEVFFIPAIGRPIWRKKLVNQVIEMGGKFVNVIHPSSQLSKWTTIGKGAIVQGQCVFTPGMVIGDFFISNDNVSIGHNTIIGDFVQINPNVNIAGGCKIGNDVYIGVKATILSSTIGAGSVIGACALITKDVPENVIAKGIPAKYTKIIEKEY